MTIPTNINGLTVTTIGQGAFDGFTIGLSNLTSVTIPGSVTSIGADAFEDRFELTNVTISGNVTSIGEWAFAFCSSLTNITIPDSVISIADHAFVGAGLTCVFIPGSVTNIGLYAFYCDSLRAITVDSQNPVYSSVAGVVFDKSGCTLLQYPHGGVGSYTIPGGVTNVGLEAFFGCVGLTSVTIAGSVTNLGDYAFGLCYSLAGVNFLGNAPFADTNVFNYGNSSGLFV